MQDRQVRWGGKFKSSSHNFPYLLEWILPGIMGSCCGSSGRSGCSSLRGLVWGTIWHSLGDLRRLVRDVWSRLEVILQEREVRALCTDGWSKGLCRNLRSSKIPLTILFKLGTISTLNDFTPYLFDHELHVNFTNTSQRLLVNTLEISLIFDLKQSYAHLGKWRTGTMTMQRLLMVNFRLP